MIQVFTRQLNQGNSLIGYQKEIELKRLTKKLNENCLTKAKANKIPIIKVPAQVARKIKEIKIRTVRIILMTNSPKTNKNSGINQKVNKTKVMNNRIMIIKAVRIRTMINKGGRIKVMTTKAVKTKAMTTQDVKTRVMINKVDRTKVETIRDVRTKAESSNQEINAINKETREINKEETDISPMTRAMFALTA